VKFWVRNRAGDDIRKSSNELGCDFAAEPVEINSKNIPGLPGHDQVFPEEHVGDTALKIEPRERKTVEEEEEEETDDQTEWGEVEGIDDSEE
jgi:hypothetical protein